MSVPLSAKEFSIPEALAQAAADFKLEGYGHAPRRMMLARHRHIDLTNAAEELLLALEHNEGIDAAKDRLQVALHVARSPV